MLKDTIMLNNDKNSMNSLIKNAAQGFSLINSHQLLRVSYTLILTKMKESFMRAERKQNQVLLVKDFFRLNILINLIFRKQKLSFDQDLMKHQIL